ELGPAYLSEDSMRFLVAPDLKLNWGFASLWEVVLEGRNILPLNAGPDEPNFRIVDTGLFLKGVLREGSLQGRTGPSLATEVGVLLPTVHGEPGTGASAACIVSQRWKGATLHLNGAVELTQSHTLGLFGGMILEGPYAWPVRPGAEVVVEDERDGGRVTSGILAVIWRLRENLSLDFGYKRARERDESIRELRAGLTWTFPARSQP
ncbi:MAG: hypothetical protein L0191_04020, partial [Acidobacteria bacterium]|nr:hypothetical protein [Acidobacteriota bacterium]